MKAHIRKGEAPVKLRRGTLFTKKDGEVHKLCDTVDADDEVIKVALSEENMIRPMNFQSAFNNPYVFVD